MIVWGGFGQVSSDVATGGQYNPIANSWTPTTTAGAPTARDAHTAVWTGSKMIVWGSGASGGTNTGGLYSILSLYVKN
jgi:hypothetical protein